MSYLVRRTQQQPESINKRSITVPMLKNKKKEIGDYNLGKTIGRGASGNEHDFSYFVI
jgi:hypothetical protein